MSTLLKGKTIHSQTREVISNVYNFMLRENLKQRSGLSVEDLKLKVSTACGVSLNSVRRVVSEKKTIPADKTFSTPGKKRKLYNSKCKIDQFDECAIRRIINNYHITHGERVTLKRLHQVVSEELSFKGGKSSLRTIVKNIGFKWRKCEDNRNLLIEKHDIRYQRFIYLSKIHKYRQENRNIVYLDETYIHASHTKHSGWSDGSKEGLKKPIGKGARLIVVHAGGEQGFVPGASLIYKSSSICGDYHHDMNHHNFEKWLKEMLIPNLPPKSVIVVDNASYHNTQVDKAPCSNSLKNDMIKWLSGKKIQHSPKITKVELYNIIKQYKNNFKTFRIDEIIRNAGHEILRLPPYHADLNPIEKIWGQIKGYVADKNVKFNLEAAKNLAEEKIKQITEVEWKAVCRNIRKIEDHYINSDKVLESMTERFIIHVDTDTDDDNNTDLEPEENVHEIGDPLSDIAPLPNTSAD